MRKHVEWVQPDRVSQEVEAAGERSELLARKHTGQRLSPKEEERLQGLTAKLKELLPPVTSKDLEVLLEMTEEVDRIREHARDRRRRLELI